MEFNMNSYDPDLQRLYFADLINCRDMGGMKGKDGKVFKKNILIRSGCPGIGSEECVPLLIDHGVKAVIDLRSRAEVGNYGNPFMNRSDVSFYNIPLFVGDPDASDDPTMKYLETHTMGDFYVIMAQKLGHEVVEVMRTFNAHRDGITLFHCAHGKDRTGVIAALLYLLFGASEEDIILNYKVSYEYARDFLDPLIEAREPSMKHTLRSDASNMATFLGFMKNKYDLSAEAYLEENGMSPDEIKVLKDYITQ